MSMKKLLVLFTLLSVLALSGLADAGDNIGKAAYMRGFEKDSSTPAQVDENIIVKNGRQILVGSGTYAAPAIANLTDTDTGISFDLTGAINFIIDATCIMRIWKAYAIYCYKPVVMGSGDNYAQLMNYQASDTVPVFTFFTYNGTGLGKVRNADIPTMVTGYVEAMRWTATSTYARGNFYIASQAHFSGIPSFNGSQTSAGVTTVTLGASAPVNTLTTPYTWITVVASDGATCTFPIWKIN